MKKLFVSFAVLAFLATSAVAGNGDDKKKEKCSKEKSCCKKGDNTSGAKACAGMESKSCTKKDGTKAEAKPAEKKAESEK